MSGKMWGGELTEPERPWTTLRELVDAENAARASNRIGTLPEPVPRSRGEVLESRLR